MNRRNFIVGAAGLASAAAVGLPGCSSSSSSTAGGSGGGDVTLQMVESLTNPARSVVLKKLLADFEAANPGIKVSLVSPPTEQADQKIQQMLQAGSGADVLEVRDLTVGPFSNNGWLYDMTSDIASWDGFQKLTKQAQQYSKQEGGKSYFIPYGFYGLSLFYRTDLIKQAGFSAPPKSWDELLVQATAIQDPSKNRYGYAFRGGANGSGNVVAAIEAYVADTIDRDNAFKIKGGQSIFAAPEAQAAVDTYFQLFTKAAPPSSVAWGYPEMVEGFNNGSTAFLLQDPEVIGTVSASKVLKSDQWQTAPLLTGPSGKAAQPVATSGWGIAQSSKNKAAAVKLVEFLSGDASTTFAKQNSLVPIQKTAGADKFYKTGPWASYVTMTEHPETYLTVVQPRGVAWWTEWSTKADSEVQKVLINKMSTAELLKSWDAYWIQKWKG